MLRTLPVALAAALAFPAFMRTAQAHETGGVAHLHPHGGEALIALVVLTIAVVVIWRLRRR
jgi:hypothetical protein